MKRASYSKDLVKRWETYRLPKDMVEKSFLDVGCWAGGFVREAAERGAYWSKGVDFVYDADWEVHKLEFIRAVGFEVMDVMKDSFLYYCPDNYDVVLCSGVLYHVSDPVGLLRRLRSKTKELCVIETVISDTISGLPVLHYCPGSSYDNNSSNWFLPNVPFLKEITKEVGFEIVNMFPSGGSRLCLHLVPAHRTSEKNLPRRKDYMKS